MDLIADDCGNIRFLFHVQYNIFHMKPKVGSSMLTAYPRDSELDIPELRVADSGQLVDAVRDGLPADRFDALRDAMKISTAELARAVGISESTLSRRRSSGSFNKNESERILRVARVFADAIRVMEGVENARTWMKESARALGGESPIRFVDTEPGVREVERLLGRIEHGVYG